MFGPRTLACGLLVVLLILGGCQPAQRIPVIPTRVAQPTTKPDAGLKIPLPEFLDQHQRLYWQPTTDNDRIPILFVSEGKNPTRWQELPTYWNPSALADPTGAAALWQPNPLLTAVTIAAVGPPRVEIKVPLGLEDPTPFIPADNPPTLGQWQLGRKLFYDNDYLTNSRNLACTTCHDPRYQYASRAAKDREERMHTPSLYNIVYQPRIFGDGRGETLESCLQRTFDDERETTLPGRHVWGGAIRRLTRNEVYQREFNLVYGVGFPTQDTVGRALATYCRTLLSGDSLYDRAVALAKKAGKPDPEAAHFEAALRPGELVSLNSVNKKPADVAAEIHLGYQLFHDKLPQSPTSCVACHAGTLFTDKGYHNIGLGVPVSPVDNPGRIAALPPGQRSAAMMGAYRTPSLRNVTRTPPYYHTGDEADLTRTVLEHLQGGRQWTSYTDRLFLTPDGKNRLPRHLTDREVLALVLFLRTLNGDDLPPVFQPPRW